MTARRHLDGPDRIGYWRDIIDDAAASTTKAVRERDEERAERDGDRGREDGGRG